MLLWPLFREWANWYSMKTCGIIMFGINSDILGQELNGKKQRRLNSGRQIKVTFKAGTDIMADKFKFQKTIFPNHMDEINCRPTLSKLHPQKIFHFTNFTCSNDIPEWQNRKSSPQTTLQLLFFQKIQTFLPSSLSQKGLKLLIIQILRNKDQSVLNGNYTQDPLLIAWNLQSTNIFEKHSFSLFLWFYFRILMHDHHLSMRTDCNKLVLK